MLDAISFSEDDVLYVLGDIVDRGDHPIKILQDMCLRPNVFPIMGNHEQMAFTMLRKLCVEITEKNYSNHLKTDDFHLLSEWFINGGQTTLEEFRRLSPEQREDLFDLSLGEFYAYAKENGVTVIQAHPYRNGFTTPADVSCIDALEVYNSNPRHENHTEKAIAFAKEHGIPMTAGSDAHRYEDVAQSGVLTSYEIKSAEDYVRCVMSGDLKIIK